MDIGDVEVGQGAGNGGNCKCGECYIGLSAEVGDRSNGRKGGVEAREGNVGNVEGDGGHGKVELAIREIDSAGNGEVRKGGVDGDGVDGDGADGDCRKIWNGEVDSGHSEVDGRDGEADSWYVVGNVE